MALVAAGIAAAALAEAALGLLSFGVVAGLASLAVAAAATFAGAWGGGALMRARPAGWSTTITALLVFLVMPPGLDAASLGGTALAGLVAGAARFLVAPRGSVLVNPAALGLLATGVLAASLRLAGLPLLAMPSWWVATPTLLPFVAAGAAAVAWRSRTWDLVGAYAVVSLALRLPQLMGWGLPAWDAVVMLAGSYPVLFAAAFMATEPQTLPPRAWQRRIVVGVAAAVAALPLSVGPLSATPELGLVAAGVLGALLAPRRRVRLRVVGASRPNDRTLAVEFAPDRPVRFLPGQALELVAPGRSDARGARRTLSIASPSGAATVRVAVSLPPSRRSAFKGALEAARPGDVFQATRVFGDAVPPRRDADGVRPPLLLVAGGIGITPFLSFVADRRPGDDLVLVWRTSEDAIPFVDELADVRVLLSSPRRPAVLPEAWDWLGAQRPDAATIGDAVPDAAARVAFVSGPPAMVRSLSAALRRAGVRHVHADVFSGS